MDNTQDILHTIAAEPSPDIIVLKFADSKIPVFKENRNKNYIKYGEKNNYPEYLTHLFDKSAKHNAIITGKANYIFGEGMPNGDITINRLGESLNDINKKAILDIELYGGFRFEVIWSWGGKIAEVYHVDYSTIRVAKGDACGYYYKEAWNTRGPFGEWTENNREEEEFIPAFDTSKPFGSQIYAYNEYRPMVRFYPLPSYIGCNNYIETDIEISKYYLSAIRNGMMPSKMVQFFEGDPTDDKKAEIERRFAKKFAGAENAGRFILVFNKNQAATGVKIDDLSASEVDKQFVELNKTCQQEIYAGHLVTSPMLFGIKTEGQLGGTTELYVAYSIFQNTYSKPKAATYSKEVQYLLKYSNFPGQYALMPSDPIGVQFDVKDVINALPKQFVFEKLGIPKEQWGLENIGSDNRPTPTIPISPSTTTALPGATAAETALANDNIKNLTAKQHQQLMRVIRQYSKGQLTAMAAKALLRTGLGLNEDDINSLLGIEPAPAVPVALSFEEQEEIIGMFDACGYSKRDFEILKSKKVIFSRGEEAEEDERVYIKEAFKTLDVTTSENDILELIKKDKRITAKAIAELIGESEAYVQGKIDSLTQRGYLESSTETIGPDTIIERSIPESVSVAPPPTTIDGKPLTQIFVKYSYEVKPGVGPAIIPTSRPFCIKMMGLNRLYSREDIEKISLRLGYSVFDRKGGWWGDNPECRHRWVSNIVVKKGGIS